MITSSMANELSLGSCVCKISRTANGRYPLPARPRTCHEDRRGKLTGRLAARPRAGAQIVLRAQEVFVLGTSRVCRIRIRFAPAQATSRDRLAADITVGSSVPLRIELDCCRRHRRTSCGMLLQVSMARHLSFLEPPTPRWETARLACAHDLGRRRQPFPPRSGYTQRPAAGGMPTSRMTRMGPGAASVCVSFAPPLPTFSRFPEADIAS